VLLEFWSVLLYNMLMNTHPVSSEKREYARKGAIALVRVTHIAYKGFSHSGKILNISPKGMYLETDAPLARYELFKAVIIQSEELAEGETCICGVAWAHSLEDPSAGLYGYGVQFFLAFPSAQLIPLLTQPAINAKECHSA